MKTLTLLFLMAVLAPVAAAELQVVTTISDLACIAETVGGPDAKVEALCPGSRDPHFLPAKPSLARKLAKADLLCYNGLELEIGWLPQLIDKARNPRVRPGAAGDLDCSRALADVLEVPHGHVDRGHGDVHPLGNPHYTLDPRNAARVAGLMAERMARLDPDNAVAYRQRAAAFSAEIKQRLPDWSAAAAPASEMHLIVYHRHWTYLVNWLALDVVGEIEHRPGISPSPRHVEELIVMARDLDRVGIIAARWDHQDVAKEVARRLDAPLAFLPGYSGAVEGSDDYLAFIDLVCSQLAALAAAGPEVAP